MCCHIPVLTLGKSAAPRSRPSPWPRSGLGANKDGAAVAWLYPIHPRIPRREPGPSHPRQDKGTRGGCTCPLRASQASRWPPTAHPSVPGVPPNCPEPREKQPVSRGAPLCPRRGSKKHPAPANVVRSCKQDTFQERECLWGQLRTQLNRRTPFPTPLPCTGEVLPTANAADPALCFLCRSGTPAFTAAHSRRAPGPPSPSSPGSKLWLVLLVSWNPGG